MAKEKQTYYVISYLSKNYGRDTMYPDVEITTSNPIKWLLNARKRRQYERRCITNVLTTTDKELAERCRSEMKGWK